MERTINLSDNYVPVQSIMIYRSRNRSQWDNSHYYLESHDIQIDEKGSSVLMEGKPLCRSTLVNLGKTLATQTSSQIKFKGLIPENLIHFHQEIGSSRLIWFVPEQKHSLFFTKDLSLPPGQAFTPSLIFTLKRQNLSVFAIKGNKKPSLKTKLYYAPFHNIHDNGNVCLGNAKIPSDSLKYIEETIKAWENVFWASEFSHLLGGNPIKSNLNTLYKKLIQSGGKFPSGELKRHTEFSTIEELLNNNQ